MAEHLVSRGYRVFGTARSPQKASAIPGVSLLPLDVTLAPSGLCARVAFHRSVLSQLPIDTT